MEPLEFLAICLGGVFCVSCAFLVVGAVVTAYQIVDEVLTWNRVRIYYKNKKS